MGLLWQQLGFFAIWDLKKGGVFIHVPSFFENHVDVKSRLFAKDRAEIPFHFRKDELNVVTVIHVNSTRFYWIFLLVLSNEW